MQGLETANCSCLETLTHQRGPLTHEGPGLVVDVETANDRFAAWKTLFFGEGCEVHPQTSLNQEWAMLQEKV
jgi:hypothetical protein